MSCRAVRHRLSAYLDGELSSGHEGVVAAHLVRCRECAERWQSLCAMSAALSRAPRLAPFEGIAAHVMDRLDLERRGPGLALIFRPFWAARPLMLPSLVPAALVLVSILAGALALDRDPRALTTMARGPAWERRLPASGTEANPFFLSAGISVPRIRDGGAQSEEVLAGMAEGTLFLETVVARDGSVSTVTLLKGDREQARPLLDVLRRERFEPGRFRGRPVAVSLYRLISRMEVRAPLT
jgi:hypothetical protein